MACYGISQGSLLFVPRHWLMSIGGFFGGSGALGIVLSVVERHVDVRSCFIVSFAVFFPNYTHRQPLYVNRSDISRGPDGLARKLFGAVTVLSI